MKSLLKTSIVSSILVLLSVVTYSESVVLINGSILVNEGEIADGYLPQSGSVGGSAISPALGGTGITVKAGSKFFKATLKILLSKINQDEPDLFNADFTLKKNLILRPGVYSIYFYGGIDFYRGEKAEDISLNIESFTLHNVIVTPKGKCNLPSMIKGELSQTGCPINNTFMEVWSCAHNGTHSSLIIQEENGKTYEGICCGTKDQPPHFIYTFNDVSTSKVIKNITLNLPTFSKHKKKAPITNTTTYIEPYFVVDPLWVWESPVWRGGGPGWGHGREGYHGGGFHGGGGRRH